MTSPRKGAGDQRSLAKERTQAKQTLGMMALVLSGALFLGQNLPAQSRGLWSIQMQAGKNNVFSVDQASKPLILRLKNESDREQWADETSPYHDYAIIARDQNGRNVPMAPSGQELVRTAGDIRTRSGLIPLAPQRVLNATIDLQRLYNLRVGSYTIQAVLIVPTQDEPRKIRSKQNTYPTSWPSDNIALRITP